MNGKDLLVYLLNFVEVPQISRNINGGLVFGEDVFLTCSQNSPVSADLDLVYIRDECYEISDLIGVCYDPEKEELTLDFLDKTIIYKTILMY